MPHFGHKDGDPEYQVAQEGRVLLLTEDSCDLSLFKHWNMKLTNVNWRQDRKGGELILRLWGRERKW